MPIETSHFRVFNCYPSFTNVYFHSGKTGTNPIPNYGSMGFHLKDYFENRMSETPVSGCDYLVAFLASSKSLTGIMQNDLTGMANSASVDFGITHSTEGFGLLDFRGDSWKHLVGDGIIGQSSTTNYQAYTDTVSAAVNILDHFSSKYPMIKWAYAGLPSLPKYTCFAPTAGSSFAWSQGLTNTPGATNNHWDAAHPTGASYGEQIFEWSRSPSKLTTYFNTNSIDRCRTVLENSGWACPDINPVATNNTEFGVNIHSVVDHHRYTRDLVKIANDFATTQHALERDFKVMPLVNSMLRSREIHVFDDPNGQFTNTYGMAFGASGEIVNFYSGFTGASGMGASGAADSDVSTEFLRAGMLEPAAFAGAVGFVYQDNIPLLVELACTGSTSISGDDAEATIRARNYIAKKVYNTSNTSLIPWNSVRNEVLIDLSLNVTAIQLRTFPESIPIGNGWALRSTSQTREQFPSESLNVEQYRSVRWKQCGSNCSTPANEGENPEYMPFRDGSDIECDCGGGGCPKGVCCVSVGGIGYCSDSYQGSAPGSGICENACNLNGVGGRFIAFSDPLFGAGIPKTCASLIPGGPLAAQGSGFGCWTQIGPHDPDYVNYCNNQGLIVPNENRPCIQIKFCEYPCSNCDAGYLPDSQGGCNNRCPDFPGVPDTYPFSVYQRKCREYRNDPEVCCCVDVDSDGDSDARPSQCFAGSAGGGAAGTPSGGGPFNGSGLYGAANCDRDLQDWQQAGNPPGSEIIPDGPCTRSFQSGGQGGTDVFNCIHPCADSVQIDSSLCQCCGLKRTDYSGQEESCCSRKSPGGAHCAGLQQLCNCGGAGFGDWKPINYQFFTDSSISDSMKKLVISDLYGLLEPESTVYKFYDNIFRKFPEFSNMRTPGTVGNSLPYFGSILKDSKNTNKSLYYNYTPSIQTINRIKSEFAFDRLIKPISYT